MDNQELKRLGRTDLLKLLLEERRENEQLRVRLKAVQEKLDDRTIQLEKAGSIAEASLRLNGVFTAAEAAAAQYLENIQRLSSKEEAVCQRMEAEARKKAKAICAEAEAYSRQLRSEAEQYQCLIMEKIQTLLQEQDGLRFLLQSLGGNRDHE